MAKWDGTKWTELGEGIKTLDANENINTITTDAKGNVYAAGNFYNSKHYVAWFSNSVGINEALHNNSFSLYPNPTHTSFTIQHNTLQKEEITIYNILGEIVFKDQYLPSQTEKTIDVSAIPKGVYFLRVGGGVKKVVVE